MASQQFSANLQKPIDVLTENILGPATSALLGKHKYKFIIANKTDAIMKRVQAHNDSDNWPFDSIEPQHTAVASLDVKSWSFGAMYELLDQHKIILAGSSPLMGKDKIAIEATAERSVKTVWDEMDDGNDKATGGNKCRAYIKSIEGGQKVWIYEIFPWW